MKKVEKDRVICLVKQAIDELAVLFSERKLGRRLLKKMFLRNEIPMELPEKKRAKVMFIVGTTLAKVNREYKDGKSLILNQAMEEKYPSKHGKVKI